MARKTVLVSDISGDPIPDGKGATVRITFQDARKGVRELDVTEQEAEKLGGRSVARRGRKSKQQAATAGTESTRAPRRRSSGRARARRDPKLIS
jgi:hypothetical protein